MKQSNFLVTFWKIQGSIKGFPENGLLLTFLVAFFDRTILINVQSYSKKASIQFALLLQKSENGLF